MREVRPSTASIWWRLARSSRGTGSRITTLKEGESSVKVLLMRSPATATVRAAVDLSIAASGKTSTC